MATATGSIQTITRLTPLADVLSIIDTDVKPVTPRTLDVMAAGARALATDAVAPPRPSSAIALQDGWALRADDTLGAGGYSPALLMRTPPRVEVGQTMPPDTDSVAPLDAVKVSGHGAEALMTVNPGDGVLAAGGDNDPAIPMRRAGERLRLTDLAALAAAGLSRITVREPRLRVLALRGNGIVNAAARVIAGDIDVAMAADSADCVVCIGGTGSGRNDTSVQTLMREGQVLVHGIAVTPGETAALGFAGAKPVLLLPGRLDAALAVWLLVGRRMLERLAGSHPKDEVGTTVPLGRKVSSTVGLSEVVPVRIVGGQAEPLAARYLPLSALARSDGWILVPPDSEGYSAGSPVTVRPWP
jgi:molybdopterin biosynthesis enzyme